MSGRFLSQMRQESIKGTNLRRSAPMTCLVLLAVTWLVPCSHMVGADSSFEFTATEKDFKLYFPAYLANGFFTTTTSLRGTDPAPSYMVAFMDYTSGDVSRPAAIPSWAEIDYFDGSAWLNQSPITPVGFRDYRQNLNMFDGRIETHYTWVDGSRSSLIEVNTFVSEAAPHLACASLTLTPGFNGRVRLRFTLRPHAAPRNRLAMAKLGGAALEKAVADMHAKLVLTDPTAPERAQGERVTGPVVESPTAPDRAALWYPGELQVQASGGDAGQTLIWITGRGAGGLEMAEAAAVELPGNLKPVQAKLSRSGQLVELEIAADVQKDKTYTFTKYVAASREGWGGLKEAVVGWAGDARKQGIAGLLSDHEAAWHKLWKADIVVEGNDEIQKVIHADLFSLLENSTQETRWAMQGMGLSPYYMGHVFWDSDSWDFPALVLLHPERAKSLVTYRFHTLSQAEARAKARGYKGAMYPWESDPEKGIDFTPAIAGAFAEREIHVNADAAIAQWQYYLATGDLEWLRQYGYPVIRDVAEFWTSRSTYNGQKDRYEILHVTSPDEAYNDVPNDAFTNGAAQKALRVAVQSSRALGLAPDPKWEEVAQKMYIPFSQSEQRHLDFDETVPHDKKTWMGSSISWLAYPQLDLSMSNAVRKNDFDFAIKALSDLTPDANDMVPVMLGIEAAELGDAAQSYKWLEFSMGGFLKPPFDVRSETAKNNAIYNLSISAGFLENFLYGFTGLRFTEQGLASAYPAILPAAFKSVTLKGISLHSQRFDFILRRDETGKVQLIQRPSIP
ncbi:MAG: glycoside hydrolase family 65 protein [Terriglobia bacterium]